MKALQHTHESLSFLFNKIDSYRKCGHMKNTTMTIGFKEYSLFFLVKKRVFIVLKIQL